MKALLIGCSDPAEILLSQPLIDGLRRRGFSVDHLLLEPPPEALRLLRGASHEIVVSESCQADGLRPSYALVINLNPDARAAKLAARLAHIKGFGHLFDGNSGRVVLKGKAFRYMTLQHTSEKYPVFHRVDLYESLLTEIEPLDETSQGSPRRPLQVVATDLSGPQAHLSAHLQARLKETGCESIHFKDLAGRPLVELSGCFQDVDLLITDSPEAGLIASQFDVPVMDLYFEAGEIHEKGPYSEGSLFLDPASATLCESVSKYICEHAGAKIPSQLGVPTLKQIPGGPRLHWPDMENLTEIQLWDFLLKFSSWALHFRRPHQSFASLLTRFSAALFGENIHLHNRFLFHCQLQNIAIVQEKLEELLHRSGGSLRESALASVLKGTPLPRAYAMGWLGLSDDGRSQRPSVGLMYQVRLFVSHLKLQRQLLDRCLGIFEGDSEQVYSD